MTTKTPLHVNASGFIRLGDSNLSKISHKSPSYRTITISCSSRSNTRLQLSLTGYHSTHYTLISLAFKSKQFKVNIFQN